jgi:hypothetical protein
MKTQPESESPRKLSDAEFEAALYATLRDEGYLFPNGVDDVKALEASLDLSTVPTPDTHKFGQLLRQHEEKVLDLPRSAWARSNEVDQSLAAVARNGGAISEDVRRQMAVDSAREKEAKKQNGSH